MIVTDLKYFMDPVGLINNLDLMCQRCSGRYKHQNLIITDGKEGYGKSTFTSACAYYMAYQMKRRLKLFFSVEELMKEAREHQDQVLIWDDAAYAALSVESYNKLIIDLIKVIWLARKNRNTFFINIQEVFRLKELLVSRAIALLHVYSPDKIKLGKYTYFNEVCLSKLYNDWTRRKKKAYTEHYTFRGTFPNVLYKVFDEEEYETLKDAAILTIGDEKKKKESGYKQKYDRLWDGVIELIEAHEIHQETAAKYLKVNRSLISLRKNSRLQGDVPDVNVNSTPIYIKGYIEPKSLDYLKKEHKEVLYEEETDGSEQDMSYLPTTNPFTR